MLTEVKHQTSAIRILSQAANFSSPLLLTGQEGIGKKYSVQKLAQQLFCETQEPSCSCFSCLQLKAETHPDFLRVESIEGKDIGIDPIRVLISSIDAYPTVASHKVVLIDGADRLTTPAANALLKTLEEPPSTVRFYLTAQNPKRVIPTIRSRCGMLSYQNLPEAFIRERLGAFESDPVKATVYARMAEGSLGRAMRYWGSGKLAFRDKVIALLTAGTQRDWWACVSTLQAMESELELLLQITDQLVYDLTLLRRGLPSSIHCDADLSRIQLTDYQLSLLGSGVRSILHQNQVSNMNFRFHVETLFADVFLGS